MALLVSFRDTYVSVINIKTGKITCNIDVVNCHALSVSVNWDYVITCSSTETVNEVCGQCNI